MLAAQATRRQRALIGAILVGVALNILPSSVQASHGVLVGGVVVEFLGLRPVAATTGLGACVVGGAVHNGSSQPIVVRVAYRGYDSTGEAIASAHAYLAAVKPGERREFTSSSFARDGKSGTYACSALRKVDMVEAVASPSP